jgi:hypothetical protein
MKTYPLPENLVQAIVINLNQQPAQQSRGLLNELERICVSEDEQSADLAKQAEFEKWLAQKAPKPEAAQS